jgi:hypothetical protein
LTLLEVRYQSQAIGLLFAVRTLDRAAFNVRIECLAIVSSLNNLGACLASNVNVVVDGTNRQMFVSSDAFWLFCHRAAFGTRTL